MRFAGVEAHKRLSDPESSRYSISQMKIGALISKFGWSSWMSKLLRQFNYRRTIYLEGVSFTIPSIRGITCNPTETWLTQLLAQLLPKKEGIFVDVGVNVGQTLLKVKSVELARTYIGFEPNPVCVFYVQELIKANNLQECDLLPVGIFTDDRVLEMDLFSSDDADSCASVIPDFRPNHPVHSRIHVPVFQFVSLPDRVRAQKAAIIKIDVEGAELEVVRGLTPWVTRDRPFILIEILPSHSTDNQFRIHRQSDLEQWFRDQKYGLFRVLKSKSGDYSRMERIHDIGVHSDLSLCDYLAIHEDDIVESFRLPS